MQIHKPSEIELIVNLQRPPCSGAHARLLPVVLSAICAF